MPDKKPPQENKSQTQKDRFIETAKALGADDSQAGFDLSLKKISAKVAPQKPKQSKASR